MSSLVFIIETPVQLHCPLHDLRASASSIHVVLKRQEKERKGMNWLGNISRKGGPRGVENSKVYTMNGVAASTHHFKIKDSRASSSY